jgi:hypothetical protein
MWINDYSTMREVKEPNDFKTNTEQGALFIVWVRNIF